MALRKALSLVDEVGDAGRAADGARLLLQGIEGTASSLSVDGLRALTSGLAMLGLVVSRLKRLEAVLQGDQDPAQLLGPSNAVPDEPIHGATLRAWSDHQQLKRAEDEVQRLRRLVAGDRGRRRRRRT